MVFPVYLAMTAAELSATTPPEQLCYMACHFSAYGAGLSNLPTSLPKGSLLSLNDRMSPSFHDPGLVSRQLAQLAEEVEASAILLDFQRPFDTKTAQIAALLLKEQTRPVVVSDLYARDLDCDVFLSAPPLHTPLERALESWQGRRIWLELATEPEGILLTMKGCEAFFPADVTDDGFFEEKLCIHYRMQPEQDAVRFTLWRTREDWQLYLQKAQQLGIHRAVGLYQQLYPLL